MPQRKTLRASWVAVAIMLAVLPLSAALNSVSRPEEVGFSAERLQRINQMVQRYIDAKAITGAVTIVARHGKVAHFEAQGSMDLEHKTPMRKDAIFRMASMSKPVTGVAIMMLVEDGKVRLTDPVSRFIPEFKNLKVATPKGGSPQATPASRRAPQQGSGTEPAPPRAAGAGRGAPPPEFDEVPAIREITVRDLLTHTSGLESSGLGNRGASRRAPRKSTDSLATYVPQLAKGPLDFQPGTQWS